MRSASSSSLATAALALAFLTFALSSPGRAVRGAASDVAPQDSQRTRSIAAPGGPGSDGCLVCHAGIEAMHPEAFLSCVDCHGGDATASLKLEAHVAEPADEGEDERTPPRDADLSWRRFKNPMDLRVADQTCGPCHEIDVEHLLASLHGTTAGHLSDGYYEMGLEKRRGSRFGVFPVARAPKPGGEVKRLVQVPKFMDHLPEDELATHYSDLARKECMQCHLWSQGRAVRGRVGFDGDYRGEGCAACHVEYARDGISESADRKRQTGVPGFPLRHTMTRAPKTDTCVSCHYGDASIGLHFRGLSQLPPDTPGGPNIPGTTDAQLNRVFYLNDPSMVPPDVHHERGMHCVDCHTKNDVMGDGMLHGQMEHAVEISCQACHGSFTEPATLLTERGTPLENVRRVGDEVILTSKVTGEQHVVKQAAHILDEESPLYDPVAALSMNEHHARLECYTCHAAWNVNFLGFHFSRNESLTQLDLLSGARTPGRVTTQEKVFSTWKSFYAGFNERGAIAPYLTGFSTMGSVWDEDGKLVLDQVMPVTAAGLSGMTMVHHQLHSTRPTARSCVECHRTSGTWGMGTANFRIGRQLAFIADRRGVEVVALQRSELVNSVPLLKIPLADVVDLAVRADDLQGHAQHLFVAQGGRGIHVFDVANPLAPKRVAFVASINPRAIELRGDTLYVADGIGGLKVYDASKPEALKLQGSVPTFDAHDVDVRWPWAYVADGPGGLAIVDVRVPIAPKFLSAIDLNGVLSDPNEAFQVETLFQYSRPIAVDGVPQDVRTRARNLAALVDRRRGLALVDVTEPTRPELIFPRIDPDRSDSAPPRNITYRGLALLSQTDRADTQGGEPTRERDYAYVLREVGSGANPRSSVVLYDVTDPLAVGATPMRDRKSVVAGFATEQLVAADFYTPPFRQRIVFTPGQLGVYMADVTTSRDPTQVGALPGIADAYAIAVEEFPLDRMIDESGARLKDISREESRWLYRAEIERILTVPGDVLGTTLYYDGPKEMPGETARLHLAELDTDGSGMLEGKEYALAGGAGIDDDADGRIALIELAAHGGMLGGSASDGGGATMSVNRIDERDVLASRVYADGDLARLLDGVNALAHDDDRNGSLDRDEVERALFDALDANGDGALTRDELSRYPGDLRQLRYGDATADRVFREVAGADKRMTPREFRVEDPEWQALDANRDGRVDLVVSPFDYGRERGILDEESEWPVRRTVVYPLPPNVTTERLLATFDEDEDEVLSQPELARRPELIRLADRDRNGSLEREEIEGLVATIERGGVDVCVDDFLGRWDLDGDGRIGDDELPDLVRLRLAPFLR